MHQVFYLVVSVLFVFGNLSICSRFLFIGTKMFSLSGVFLAFVLASSPFYLFALVIFFEFTGMAVGLMSNRGEYKIITPGSLYR